MNGAAPEIVTFGCRLNILESENMLRHAVAADLRDVVILNSCAVTAEAERQAGQAIRRIKRENPSKKIIVTGCASHINPAKYSNMSEVDRVIANDVKLLAESFSDPLPTLDRAPSTLKGKGLVEDDIQTMQRAFVQVQNGCDHRCTFCIIPFGRGASRSLPAAEITRQIAARIAEGFQEIVLTGVDIASYGKDLPHQPRLGSAVKHLLAASPGLRRLRLSSLDPAAIDDDLWQLIADEPRLMPHLHLSLQAGDDMVLKRMKRRHTRDDVLRLCDKARRLRPDIVFGADIIAGFPTETDGMFRNTYDLVEQCGMTWLHVFPYSARAGTPAAKMPSVHGSLRKERAEKLRQLGDKAAHAHYRSLIGQTIPVLVENNQIGCTPHFAKLKLIGAAQAGDIVDALCEKTEGHSVIARVK